MDLTENILKYVEKHEKTNSMDLAKEFNEDHQKVIGGINSILAHDNEILHVEPISKKEWKLTKEGEEIVEKGSHEANLFAMIPAEGIEQEKLMKVSCKISKPKQSYLMTKFF